MTSHASDTALVPFVSAQNMMRLVLETGIEQARMVGGKSGLSSRPGTLAHNA